jgi:3-oxoacyl-(acyl-carrier-protein) synthase
MPPVSGIKAIFGHTLGAAGALDAACCILAIQHQLLPPTAAHAEPLRGLDWDFVPGKARPPAGSLDVLLSTNSAFGGNNSALILRRWNGAEA